MLSSSGEAVQVEPRLIALVSIAFNRGLQQINDEPYLYSSQYLIFISTCAPPLRGLGADDVVDYTRGGDGGGGGGGGGDSVARELQEIVRTAGRPFDIVIDTVSSHDARDASCDYPSRIRSARDPPQGITLFTLFSSTSSRLSRKPGTQQPTEVMVASHFMIQSCSM